MITTPLTGALVRGAAELEETGRGLRPHRLPAPVRTRFPDPQLLAAESQPSGVRLVMATAARTVELVLHPTRATYRGISRPRGSVDLVVDGERLASEQLDGGDHVETDLRTGTSELHAGPACTIRFAGLADADKAVEIWLPHNEAVELVALRTDAPVRPVEPTRRVWLHHGSSISHGSNAATPTGIWPAVAARHGDVELHNLGFGGSALADQFVARVMRDRPADLISVKLGINVVNFDAMRLRAFVPAVHGFLDTVRDGHPGTPLVLISPIFCGVHEDTPGPGELDADALAAGEVAFTATGPHGPAPQLTLRIIRDALRSLAERREDDPRLHYLDGTRLYGEQDAITHPLPDALHPDAATHELIGERFARYAFAPGGPFAGR
ncbi:GDSL-like Lipase/Acylhydrolase family protein [Lentzea xinjiangensis]|uniref:GDSL-like Lipase/Acylhydrolase family protein n=1 Tax=Lentzea xinjiangensis TaxID=402600 RepID=A0A1H9RGG9_9PSEU|nr:GDSL-type esterase/lipase family protein [Lentzea xinjiangensis]SER71836.1 GDSL-like Lipase/Acylhydrolase family protein [Lentzea xinjiangensis]